LFFIIILLFRWLGDGRGLPSSSLTGKMAESHKRSEMDDGKLSHPVVRDM